VAQKIIGLDLGQWSLKAVIVHSSLRRTVIERYLEIPVARDENGEASEECINTAVEKFKREIRRDADLIISALSGSDVSIRRLSVPNAALKQIEQILPFELDGQIPFSVDDALFKHRVLGKAQDSTNLMVMAVRKDTVQEHVQKLGQQGIEPNTLTYAPMVYEILMKGSHESSVVLDIGFASTNACFVENGRAVSGRTLPFGGRNLNRTLMKKGNIGWDAAEKGKIDWGLESGTKAADVMKQTISGFVRDLRQTIAAHLAQGWEAPQKIYMCGGTSRLKGIVNHISAETGIPAERLEVLDEVEMPMEADTGQTSGALAVCLARIDELGRDRRVDFRTGELAYRGDVNYLRQRAWMIAAGLALILCAWVFSALTERHLLMQESEQQKMRLSAMTQSLMGEEIADYRKLDEMLKDLKVDKAPIPPIDAFDVLDELSARIDENIIHDIENIEIRPSRVSIRGEVDSDVAGGETTLSPIDLIKNSFEGWKECVTGVKVGRTTSTNNGERLKYTMEVDTKCPRTGKGD